MWTLAFAPHAAISEETEKQYDQGCKKERVEVCHRICFCPLLSSVLIILQIGINRLDAGQHTVVPVALTERGIHKAILDAFTDGIR